PALALNRASRVAFGPAIVAAVFWSSLAFRPSLPLRTAGVFVTSILRRRLLLRTGGFRMFTVILLPLSGTRFVAPVFVLAAGVIFAPSIIFALCILIS